MIVPRGAEPVKVDYLIKDTDNIYGIVAMYLTEHNLDCVLVDEAQFLNEKNISELTDVVDLLEIPVICYGLREDFQGKLFPGSKALFENADSLEELKTVCECGTKAIRNIRYVNGILTYSGDQVAIDGKDDVTYVSVCRKCEKKLIRRK